MDHLLHASLTATPLAVDLVPVASAGPAAVIGAVTVEAMPLEHPVPTFGWRFSTPPSRHLLPDALAAVGLAGPAVGRLVRDGAIDVGGRRVLVDDVSLLRPGLCVAVVLDTRLCDNAVRLAQDADLLVCESTFRAGEEAMAGDYGHLTSTQAATIARQAGAQRLVLTHFSGRHAEAADFAADAATVFPDVVAAVDLDVVEITRRPDPPQPRHRSG